MEQHISKNKSIDIRSLPPFPLQGSFFYPLLRRKRRRNRKLPWLSLACYSIWI